MTMSIAFECEKETKIEKPFISSKYMKFKLSTKTMIVSGK